MYLQQKYSFEIVPCNSVRIAIASIMHIRKLANNAGPRFDSVLSAGVDAQLLLLVKDKLHELLLLLDKVLLQGFHLLQLCLHSVAGCMCSRRAVCHFDRRPLCWLSAWSIRHGRRGARAVFRLQSSWVGALTVRKFVSARPTDPRSGASTMENCELKVTPVAFRIFVVQKLFELPQVDTCLFELLFLSAVPFQHTFHAVELFY
mmetsp:Transcript_28500/g.40067  ORF Transcript_28500/g.40067 Transcript_28500/m.40067 type:complete len:203 (-) Transcript_28500:1982-2590(-)